jgi:hypothetical protein
MAINTNIIDALVKEIISEKMDLPYTHCVNEKDTKRRYEVTVREITNSDRYLNESNVSLESAKFGTVLGPRGQPCGCCNGSGRQ